MIEVDQSYRLLPYAHLVSVPDREGFIFYEDTEEEFSEPLDPDEVEVEMVVVLVDGSDIHTYRKDGAMHPNAIGRIFIPLHEGAGFVTGVGEKVTNVEVGDMVAFESTIPQDDTERPSLGDVIKILGLGENGLASRRVRIPRQIVIKTPNGMEPELAAQLEPWGVSIHAILRGQKVYEVITGEDPKEAVYLINGGTGSIGRLMIASLLADGISPEHILATGRTPEKLERLTEAFPGIKVANIKNPEDIARLKCEVVANLERFDGKVPIVVEATGYDPSNLLEFIGQDCVFVAVGLSSRTEDPGVDRLDNNNYLVRSQRVIWKPSLNMDKDSVLEKAQAIYRSTISETQDAEILVIEKHDVVDKHLAEGIRFDVVIDKVGVSPFKLDKLTRKGAIWVVSNTFERNDTLPTEALLEAGAILVGSWARDWEDWEKMFELYEGREFKEDELDVKLYPFTRKKWRLAFEKAGSKKTGLDMRDKNSSS